LDICLDALRRYGQRSLHFVDCVIAAHAASSDVPVATFDSDFRKMSDVRIEIQ
jgi:predicted nucleic acid-binding protein